jgi:hypothetical protein
MIWPSISTAKGIQIAQGSVDAFCTAVFRYRKSVEQQRRELITQPAVWSSESGTEIVKRYFHRIDGAGIEELIVVYRVRVSRNDTGAGPV